MLRNRKVLIGVGAAVFLSSTYFTYALASANRSSSIDSPTASTTKTSPPATKHSCSETRDIYNKISSSYDKKVGFDEYLIGVTKLRKKIFSTPDSKSQEPVKAYQIKGPHVLEVAAGTGRNIDFICDYLVPNNTISQVDVTDYSDLMIKEAYIKYAKWQRKLEKRNYVNKRKASDKVQFKLVDAHALTEELPPKYYDTVIDTYGLCSFEDPEKVLREMVKVCKPDGKIILLEHGRTLEQKSWVPFYRSWLNHYLDRTAPKRAQDWGCWWNRDIEGIVQKCNDVLFVERVEYHQFGTCYLIVARPKYLQDMPNPAVAKEEVAAVANLFAHARQITNPTGSGSTHTNSNNNLTEE